MSNNNHAGHETNQDSERCDGVMECRSGGNSKAAGAASPHSNTPALQHSILPSFAQGLATRLSLHFGSELLLSVARLETLSCCELMQGWSNPSHFTMFKLEPLRGICVLELSSPLAHGMADKLMGGTGRMPETICELSEIERLVLEPTVESILQEWCGLWSKNQELKPVVLGNESNARFIQFATPETKVLLLVMDATVGECAGSIVLAFPLATMEPLLQKLTPQVPEETVSTAKLPTTFQWNACFDDVPLALTAEWPAVELSAREVLTLKVGDVLPMDLQSTQRVEVRLADQMKFLGRPGSIAGQWAVELTQVINR